jgi:hypothetical protein
MTKNALVLAAIATLTIGACFLSARVGADVAISRVLVANPVGEPANVNIAKSTTVPISGSITGSVTATRTVSSDAVVVTVQAVCDQSGACGGADWSLVKHYEGLGYHIVTANGVGGSHTFLTIIMEN